MNKELLENKLNELMKSEFIARQKLIELETNIKRIQGAIEITKEYLKEYEKENEAI